MTGADAAAVLVIVPIDDIVAAIFDCPMPPVSLEDPSRIGLLLGSAGDAVGEFMGLFPAFLFDGVPFDGEGLAEMGEVELAVERRGSPDLAGLDAPMVGGRVLDKVRLFSILEEQDDILKQGRLVAFDGEVVIGLLFFDQVRGQFSLSQQGIGSDVLVF